MFLTTFHIVKKFRYTVITTVEYEDDINAIRQCI